MPNAPGSVLSGEGSEIMCPDCGCSEQLTATSKEIHSSKEMHSGINIWETLREMMWAFLSLSFSTVTNNTNVFSYSSGDQRSLSQSDGRLCFFLEV